MMWDSGFLTDYTTKWRREADRRMREMKKMGIDALIRAMDVISYIYAHVYLCKTSVFMTIYISEKKNKTNIGSEQINFLNYLYKCCIELLHKHNKSKKPTGKINKDHLTEYLLGFNDSISIYNRITCCIYKPEIHPCLDKWYTTKIPGLKITNRQISKGLRKLFSIQTCFKHLKYSQELILCSFRIEKHLIHFPDHPTKK